MIGARSTNGCYTCRIRKKKCDEGRPICFMCSSRHIPCYGYGPKPSWFRDAVQGSCVIKDVEEIKRAALKSYKSKRSSRTGQSKSPIQAQSMNSKTAEDASTYSKIGHVNRSGESNNYDVAEGSNKWRWVEPVELGTEQQLGHRSTKSYSTGFTRYLVNAGRAQTVKNIWWDGGITNICSARDLTMLNYFFELIFPLQYGFYNSLNTTGGRDWLTRLLLQARPLFHASLSITVCFQSRVLEGNLNGESNLNLDMEKLHSLSLTGLQRRVYSLSTTTGWSLFGAANEVLACMHQLLSFEVFRTLGGNWQVHQNAARTLLSIIDNGLFPPHLLNASQSVGFHRSYSAISTFLADPQTSKTEEATSFAFFLTVFVWGDILSIATFGPDAPTNFQYVHLLQNNTLQLHKIMGCQNWAMVFLLDISHLEHWKREAQKTRTLSLEELLHRADNIEKRLRLNLFQVSSEVSSLNSQAADSSLVTSVFAHAALVYLRVAVFGGHPSIPEIHNTVYVALCLLESLPLRLQIRVCWPIGIIGSMIAEEANQKKFRELYDRGQAERVKLGAVWKAWEVIEECWRLRREGSGNLQMEGCDWRTAMRSLGLRILLI